MKESKKESKLKYLRVRLEDPNTPEYEKKNIRRRLGIYFTITEKDFEECDQRTFRTYIEEQSNRLDKLNKAKKSFDSFPQPIKDYYFLTEFSSILESDCFRDYSDKKIPKYLTYDRDNMYIALKNIGYEHIVEELGKLWKKDKISENEIENLQNKYWNKEFELVFNNKINELITNNKSDFLLIQK